MSQDIHQNHYILGIYQVFFLASLPGNPENDGPAAIRMTRYYCYCYYYYYYYYYYYNYYYYYYFPFLLGWRFR